MKQGFASLLPYRKRGDAYEYFVQKRALTAKRAAGQFGLFGGKLEVGETPDAAVLREIREELTYECIPVPFFSYEFVDSFLHVYIEAVDADFESRIQVQEGEYGVFLTLQEVMAEPLMNPMAATAILEVDRMLEVAKQDEV